jgi:hypothetical protein
MEREMHGAVSGDLTQAVDALGREVVRLRKSLLRLGHAQELHQGRVEEAVDRLSRRPAVPEAASPAGGGALDGVQLRVLMELDQAVLHLLEEGEEGEEGGAPLSANETGDTGDGPRSVREGLSLLQIRVRNLQRSFGLEPIPARGRPFDDRLHEAHGVCDLPGLADGTVAEELLPGYLLRGRVVRPARVIVNRREASEEHP